MDKIELEALRKRARMAGVDLGSVAMAERTRASRQFGINPPAPEKNQQPSKIEMEGVRRWVVAVCRPAMAPGVAEDLNMIGFRAYCPMGKKIVYRGRHGGEARQRRVHQFPVFGRYLFVGEIEDPFQTTLHSGVVAIIGDRNGAWPVNPAAVKAINDAELSGTWDSSREAEAAFRRGDLVRVVSDLSHPFAGFNAIVDSIRKSGVRINVDIFGRSTPITIPQDKLELV